MTNNNADNCDYFEVTGTVDINADRYLRELPARVRHDKVRIDFSKAGRINSMGVALLLRCLKEIREKRQATVLLEGLAPMHTMLFKMTGIFLLATPVDGKGGLS